MTDDRADRKEISQWLILGRSLIAGEARRPMTEDESFLAVSDR